MGKDDANLITSVMRGLRNLQKEDDQNQGSARRLEGTIFPTGHKVVTKSKKGLQRESVNP
ncbi:hypothetical protein [Desulfocicer vacuolatum]|uniref:hypothetical protein n=1 Tax=Desulfocicer vacuolatum TaxID=2298 RepID=UPI000A071BB0|nr:hypothetical protein [Desulfocicer vacuolatum]